MLEGNITVPVYYVALAGALACTTLLAALAAFYRSRQQQYQPFELDLPPAGYEELKPDKRVNW